jgi:hypothetical protein
MSPITCRALAEECKGTGRMTWYSDGKGPHFMGMQIHTPIMPDNFVILQDLHGEVIAACAIEKATP